MTKTKKIPIVSIIMGSQSDWEFVKPASDILSEFAIPHESKIISAHRTPKRHSDFAKNAKKNGIKNYFSRCWWGCTSSRCYSSTHISSSSWFTHGPVNYLVLIAFYQQFKCHPEYL